MNWIYAESMIPRDHKYLKLSSYSMWLLIHYCSIAVVSLHCYYCLKITPDFQMIYFASKENYQWLAWKKFRTDQSILALKWFWSVHLDLWRGHCFHTCWCSHQQTVAHAKNFSSWHICMQGWQGQEAHKYPSISQVYVLLQRVKGHHHICFPLYILIPLLSKSQPAALRSLLDKKRVLS